MDQATLEPLGVRTLIDVATEQRTAQLRLFDLRGFCCGFTVLDLSVEFDRIEGDPLSLNELTRATFKCVRDGVSLEFLRNNSGKKLTFGQYTRRLDTIDEITETTMTFTLIQPVTQVQLAKARRRAHPEPRLPQ